MSPTKPGWVAAEVGRQPWIVYAPAGARRRRQPGRSDAEGHYQFDESQGLRTTDGVSRAIAAEQVVGSIIMFGGIYALLFVLWVYVLHQKISHGPDPHDPSRRHAPRRPRRRRRRPATIDR